MPATGIAILLFYLFYYYYFTCVPSLKYVEKLVSVVPSGVSTWKNWVSRCAFVVRTLQNGSYELLTENMIVKIWVIGCHNSILRSVTLYIAEDCSCKQCLSVCRTKFLLGVCRGRCPITVLGARDTGWCETFRRCQVSAVAVSRTDSKPIENIACSSMLMTLA
jgi:hypothetical protein